jgi:hypothetical protein
VSADKGKRAKHAMVKESNIWETEPQSQARACLWWGGKDDVNSRRRKKD